MHFELVGQLTLTWVFLPLVSLANPLNELRVREQERVNLGMVNCCSNPFVNASCL